MIKATQISKQFRLPKAQQRLEGRSSSLVQALHPMSFELAEGELLLVLGTKNAGKSTLLKLIGGVLSLDSGHLEIKGQQTSPTALHAQVGWVIGDQAIFPDLTVLEQLRYFGQLQGLRGDQLKSRLQAVLERWQLKDLRKRRTKLLSAKQRRYLAIAQALIHEPKILLLDEPSFGLDIFNSYPVVDLMQYAKMEGISTILATNNLSKAELIGDQLAVLHQGQLIYFDQLNKFKAERTEPTLSEAFIGLIEAIR